MVIINLYISNIKIHAYTIIEQMERYENNLKISSIKFGNVINYSYLCTIRYVWRVLCKPFNKEEHTRQKKGLRKTLLGQKDISSNKSIRLRLTL